MLQRVVCSNPCNWGYNFVVPPQLMRKLEQHIMDVVCESEYNFVVPPTPVGNYSKKRKLRGHK